MTLVNLPSEIANYIAYVRAATVPQRKDQIALCNHVERCFASEDIYVDENQLHRYLAQQKYFPFKLLSWEIFIFTLHNSRFINQDGKLINTPNVYARPQADGSEKEEMLARAGLMLKSYNIPEDCLR